MQDESSVGGASLTAAHSHVGTGCEGSAPTSCAPTAPPCPSGVSHLEFIAMIRDGINPLAVSRYQVLSRNPKVGTLLMTSPKAGTLARRILKVASKPEGLDERDVANMMGAAAKRARKMRLRREAA